MAARIEAVDPLDKPTEIGNWRTVPPRLGICAQHVLGTMRRQKMRECNGFVTNGLQRNKAIYGAYQVYNVISGI
jgi:hypothetical protein